jgi:hypothetical protein
MNQESVGVIARDGFSKLMQGPGGSRMGRNIALQNAATSTSITTNTYSTRKPAVIATKKSLATMALA